MASRPCFALFRAVASGRAALQLSGFIGWPARQQQPFPRERSFARACLGGGTMVTAGRRRRKMTPYPVGSLSAVPLLGGCQHKGPYLLRHPHIWTVVEQHLPPALGPSTGGSSVVARVASSVATLLGGCSPHSLATKLRPATAASECTTTRQATAGGGRRAVVVGSEADGRTE